MGAPAEGRAYPRDGGIVEGDRDERGAAGGLGRKGEWQPQEEGERGQHCLAGREEARALTGCGSAPSLIYSRLQSWTSPAPTCLFSHWAVCSGMKQ